jgi:Tfp pilus assembly protein PilE
MKKIQKNEFGFSAVEVLLVILILVVIGAAGYLVYHNNRKTVNATNAASKTSAVKSTESAKTTTPAHTPQDAAAFVQSTYNKFLSAAGNVSTYSTQSFSQVGLSAVQSNLTSNFYTQASASQNASDFTCEGQFLANAYTVGAASDSGTSATVPVTISNGPGGNSSGDSTTTTGMTVNVDLNSLLITSVTCPANSN